MARHHAIQIAMNTYGPAAFAANVSPRPNARPAAKTPQTSSTTPHSIRAICDLCSFKRMCNDMDFQVVSDPELADERNLNPDLLFLDLDLDLEGVRLEGVRDDSDTDDDDPGEDDDDDDLCLFDDPHEPEDPDQWEMSNSYLTRTLGAVPPLPREHTDDNSCSCCRRFVLVAWRCWEDSCEQLRLCTGCVAHQCHDHSHNCADHVLYLENSCAQP
eukprot:m.156049 g.156049  ORF g.156049 m.156049 type:complete len:215 (+) comp10212_c0_seq5:436-1080(+)